MQPAKISSRFAAMNLDFIFFGVFWQGLVFIFNELTPELVNSETLLWGGLAFSFLYFLVPTQLSGQTLGKKLLAIKVVPKGHVRGRLTWGQVILREVVGKILSSLVFFLGYIWAYFDTDHKAWHDRMSDTLVIALIWEEEKTFAHKIQQLFLAILSIPAGSALILFALLYTQLPLDPIKDQIEAAGFKVGTMSGSLGGGLKVRNFEKPDGNQPFQIQSLELKINFWALLQRKVFIDRVIVENAQIEVPEDFSLKALVLNSVDFLQNPEDSGLQNFTLARLQFKDISFQAKAKTLAKIDELRLKNMAIVDGDLFVHELEFDAGGLVLKVNELKTAKGTMTVPSATGGFTPEFWPLLKSPVDFHFEGNFFRNSARNRWKAGFMIDKIKMQYEESHLTGQADQLILNELFKMSAPIDDLTMKFSAQGKSLPEWFSSLHFEYALKICGQGFKPDPQGLLRAELEDRHYSFLLLPAMSANLGETLTRSDVVFEDLFTYRLNGARKVAPFYPNEEEMIAELCYQKPVASLEPIELEKITAFQQALHGKKSLAPAVTNMVAASASAAPAPAQTPRAASVATLVPTPNSTPVLTLTPAQTPTSVASPSASPTVSVAASPTAPPVSTTLSPTIKPTEAPSPIASPAATLAPTASPSPAQSSSALPLQTPMPSPTVTPLASPAAASNAPVVAVTPTSTNLVFLKATTAEAMALSRQGKFAEAKVFLEGTPVLTAGVPAAELGAFYNMKGWIYLFANSPYQSMQNFNLAFEARRDISDAEGLHRSYEALKKEPEALKWLEYMKTTLKEHPEQIKDLSPKMQEKLSAASAK